MVFPNGEKLYCNWVDDRPGEDDRAKISVHTGDRYAGGVDGGLRNGRGMLHYANESRYEGKWKKDNREGHGIITFRDKSFFEGIFTSDTATGFGVLCKRNAFLDEAFHEYDVPRDYLKPLSKFRVTQRASLASNDIMWIPQKKLKFLREIFQAEKLEQYKPGSFQVGKLNGAAICCYGDYAEYHGTYKNGNRHGIGKMEIKTENQIEYFGHSESVYTGEWADDMRHGKGEMAWSIIGTYIGYWRCDRRHNVRGKMTFKDGEVYEGNWVDDTMNGAGSMTYATTGNTFRGTFIDGAPAKYGVLEFPDERVYDGSLMDMLPEGQGCMKYPNKDIYNGKFEEGKRWGFGK